MIPSPSILSSIIIPDEEHKNNDHDNKSAKSMPSFSSIYNKVDRVDQAGFLSNNGPVWTLPQSALSTTNV